MSERSSTPTSDCSSSFLREQAVREVSFITKALAAVLQLAVTMDYSIFLWHSYEEQKGICENHKQAMAVAIHETVRSVIGSSITTVAGFIALCFMTFTLGLDLGIVMAKGVILGVISCVTVLPSLILVLSSVGVLALIILTSISSPFL